MKNKKLKWVAVSTLVGIVASILTIVGCNKNSSTTSSQQTLVADYYASMKKALPPLYDYIFTSIVDNEKLNQKTAAEIIQTNASSAVINIKPIDWKSPNVSQAYKDFMTNLRAAIQAQKLLNFSDFDTYGKTALPKITDKDEKNYAAYLLALGATTAEYVTKNAPFIKMCYSSMSNTNQRNFIDSTGMLHFYNTSANTIKTIVVVAVVVAAVVITAGLAASALAAAGIVGAGATVLTIGAGLAGGYLGYSLSCAIAGARAANEPPICKYSTL